MKYSIFAIVLAAFFATTLTGCGEPKPGSKPPSLYKDEKGDRMGADSGQK